MSIEKIGYKVINMSYSDMLYTNQWYNRTIAKENGIIHIPLIVLSNDIENMARCNGVYFCKGWQETKGNMIMYQIAMEYGLEIMFEEEVKKDE